MFFIAAPISHSGRAAMAWALQTQALHLAWGTGKPEWDEMSNDEIRSLVLPPLARATKLEAEIGRRAPAVVCFVEPDEAGEITVPIGGGESEADEIQYARYKQVEGPSPYLYLSVKFDYGDAPNVVIREMALFLGTQVKPDLPPGQRYFKPADLLFPGYHISTQIIKPAIARSASVRPNAEWVLPV